MCYQSVHVYNYLFYVLYCSPPPSRPFILTFIVFLSTCALFHVHNYTLSVLFIMWYGVVSHDPLDHYVTCMCACVNCQSDRWIKVVHVGGSWSLGHGDVQQDQCALTLLHLWLVKFPWVVESVMWVGASQLEGVQLAVPEHWVHTHVHVIQQ